MCRHFIPQCGSLQSSFYNFTNIYMWRDVMNYRVNIIGGVPVLTGSYHNEPTFAFFPAGMPAHCVGNWIERIRDATDAVEFRPLVSDIAKSLLNVFPDAEIAYRRDLCDYVYLTDDLINLAGKKLHGKRNHVNAFHRLYDGRYNYIPVTQSNLGLLRETVDLLFTQHDDIELCEEYAAIQEILDAFTPLGVKAAVITIDGRPVAYTIGERMNADTALIHIEKADRDYEGAYAAINNEFIKNEFADTAFVNREEDMGHDGLRKAKESYNPHHLNDIYSAVLTQ